MLQNTTVTAFTVSELLREKPRGLGDGGRGKITSSPTQIRINNIA